MFRDSAGKNTHGFRKACGNRMGYQIRGLGKEEIKTEVCGQDPYSLNLCGYI